MNDSATNHIHFDDELVDDIARARINDLESEPLSIDCSECEAKVAALSRYLSLARLLTRDSRQPDGSPAVDAVRTIRRQSYRRRALGEIAALLTTAPTRARV